MRNRFAVEHDGRARTASARERGSERALGTTPPCDGPPSLKAEHLVRRNRPDVWDGPLARTSAGRPGRGDPDLGGVAFRSGRDPDSPGRAAWRERVPKAAAAAVCGIG